MVIVRSLLIVLEILCCVMLIALVLLQKTKSEGLGLAFGSGMGDTLFGSRAGNVLTKATIALGIGFLICTLALAVVYSGSQETSLMDKVMGPRQAPAQQAPARRPAQQTPVDGASGVPTLPGADLDASAPAPVPVEIPAAPVAE